MPAAQASTFHLSKIGMTRGKTRRASTTKKPITHLFFDWSGTLARKGSREAFLAADTRRKALSTLYKDTLPTLKTLRGRGYTMGIISNTSVNPAAFKRGLRKAGLALYFKGPVVTNTRSLCRKPCPAIFKAALSRAGLRDPAQALMVGNKYAKDIVGARRVGMRAYQRTRRSGGFSGLAQLRD